MSEILTQFVLQLNHRREMLTHILACLPEEACGLLGGRIEPGRRAALSVLPVENELHSPFRFRMNPVEQLKAFYWFEEQSQELVGIFHSHPAGPPVPSPTDLAEFAYPGVLSLIWSPDPDQPGEWQARGFAITAGQAVEVPILWSASPSHPTGV